MKPVPPKGAALGWYFKFDDDVRSSRAALGYTLPELTAEEQAWLDTVRALPEPEPEIDDEAF